MSKLFIFGKDKEIDTKYTIDLSDQIIKVNRCKISDFKLYTTRYKELLILTFEMHQLETLLDLILFAIRHTFLILSLRKKHIK